MSTLESIRKRSGLLLIVVGVGIFLFIASDFFTNKSGTYQEPIAGEVNGKKIKSNVYEKQVDLKEKQYRALGYGQNSPSFSDEIRTMVWNNLIDENIYGEYYNELGLSLTDNEIDEVIFGKNMLPEIIQAFAQQFPDSLGGFDRNAFASNIRRLESGQTDAQTPQEQEQIKLTRLNWQLQKEVYLKNYLRSKFNTLFEKGVFVTTNEAKMAYEEKNAKVDFDFVYMPFIEMADSAVNVSESDIKSYYNEHKEDKKFAQKESRQFQFVSFNIAPSSQDDANAKQWVADRKTSFENAENDTVYLRNNTENFNAQFFVEYKKGDIAGLDSLTESTLLNGDSGTVVGPVKDVNSYKLLKIEHNGPLAERNASHILIAVQDTSNLTAMNSAKKTLDSLKAEISDSSSFAELAKIYGMDGTKQNGGELGWFGKKQMVREFSDAAFSGQVGQLSIVKTQFGYHLIRINGARNDKKTIIGVLEKPVEVSDETLDNIYNEANSFAIASKKGDFETIAKENDYFVQTSNDITLGLSFIQGIQNPKDFIRWAYDAEVDQVSEPLDDGDTKFVIAKLTNATEEGVPSFDAVKELMKAEVIKEKKAEAYSTKLNGTDINSIAQNVSKTVMPASNVSFANTYIPGASNEPKVVGTAFGLADGTLSNPIVGNSGVFVILVKGKTAAPDTDDYSTDKQSLISSTRSGVTSSVYSSLRTAADVKDYRLIDRK